MSFDKNILENKFNSGDIVKVTQISLDAGHKDFSIIGKLVSYDDTQLKIRVSVSYPQGMAYVLIIKFKNIVSIEKIG